MVLFVNMVAYISYDIDSDLRIYFIPNFLPSSAQVPDNFAYFQWINSLYISAFCYLRQKHPQRDKINARMFSGIS